MPEISNEMLDNQLQTLSEQRDKALSDVAAINGAIQLCSWLIAQLNEPELPTPDGAEIIGAEQDGK